MRVFFPTTTPFCNSATGGGDGTVCRGRVGRARRRAGGGVVEANGHGMPTRERPDE